jgi:hypothetical protein
VSAAQAEPDLAVCVPKTSFTSCDQAIFVDQATDAHVFVCGSDRGRQAAAAVSGGGCVQRAVRPVQIVVSLVLPQMILNQPITGAHRSRRLAVLVFLNDGKQL